eukprot:597428-Prorocentrum_minimum.AAC.1
MSAHPRCNVGCADARTLPPSFAARLGVFRPCWRRPGVRFTLLIKLPRSVWGKERFGTNMDAARSSDHTVAGGVAGGS